jgi:hypothetical protein
MTDTKREAPASLEKRAAALEIVLRRKADMPKSFVAEFTEHADDAWNYRERRPDYKDLDYRARVVRESRTLREMGLDLPATTIIGAAPDWYLWDALGSEFGSRHVQYEMFYAGEPAAIQGREFRSFDWAAAEALVDHCLASYDIATV